MEGQSGRSRNSATERKSIEEEIYKGTNGRICLIMGGQNGRSRNK